MEDLKLTAAALTDGVDVMEMLQEIGPGENGFQNSAYSLSESDFTKWLQSLIDMANGINLDPKYVPMTTYWLKRNGYPIGTSKLRHRLNEGLMIKGGHIGFCIRPSERKKGYANEILVRTVQAAHHMGIDRVLLTCEIENKPSWITIEHCGGILEKMANGHRYYWIETNTPLNI